MYPTIHINDFVFIYTFGLFLIGSWIAFFMALQYFSLQKGIIKSIFSSIIWCTLSIFFMSRIFYIFTDWRTERWIFVDLFETGDILTFLGKFFITDNYSLSFAGGVVGFLVFFFIQIWKKKREIPRYLDIIVPAFLIAASIGYLGAFLGGQIYGVAFESFLSVQYTNPESIVPLQSPTFPLPVFYSICCLSLVFTLIRLESKRSLPDGLLGHIGMGGFMGILFIAEFANGADDLFSSRLGVNLNQILAICIIIYSLLGLSKIIRS